VVPLAASATLWIVASAAAPVHPLSTETPPAEGALKLNLRLRIRLLGVPRVSTDPQPVITTRHEPLDPIVDDRSRSFAVEPVPDVLRPAAAGEAVAKELGAAIKRPANRGLGRYCR
jgi:hypothetical protein